MGDERQAFIKFAIASGVLKFGEFKLKSGRISPYFFNAGLFNTGRMLARLGKFYARAIVDSGLSFDMLFGPAYKGIPLATITATALSEHHGIDVPYAFNRKETKDHGERGQLVGAPLAGQVLIVDDVITAGTAIGEAVELIREHGAQVCGVVVCLDREERGAGDESALQEVGSLHGIRPVAVAGLHDLLGHLEHDPERAGALAALRAYSAEYGCQR